MYMVKFRKFCNNNDDNLNKKKAILYYVHYIWWATRLGHIKFFKSSGHSLELLLQYWTAKENTSKFNMFTEFNNNNNNNNNNLY